VAEIYSHAADRSRSAHSPPIGARGQPSEAAEAIPALTTTPQSESDPEVRQMAAFAMGLSATLRRRRP
jgi:hypothetical protein